MKIVCYEKKHQNEWDEFITNSKNAHFMFYRNYMEYHSDRFQDFSHLIYKDEKLIAIFPANTKDNIVYSHQGLTFGGFLTDVNMKTPLMLEVFENFLSYLEKQNITKLIYKTIPKIYHKYPAEEDLYALFINKAKTVKKEPSSLIELNNKIGFNTLRKRMVKKAVKNNLIVKQSSDYKSFFEIEKRLLKEKYDARPAHNHQEMELLASRFPENIKLFASFKDDKMLAGVIVYKNHKTVHAQYIGSSEEGKHIGALDLVMDYLINDIYKDEAFFDFGISSEDDGLYLNKGLISQKEMFGGRAIVFETYEIDLCQNLGAAMNNFIHKTSDVQSKNIGEGTKIWQYCVVLPNAKIGSDCNVCCHCLIENDVTIGNNVTIKCGVYVWDGVVIEDNVFIGANVNFSNDKYPKSGNKDFNLLKTTIKKGASIGSNCTILPGVTIGENAVVGGGAIVTKDIPDNAIYYNKITPQFILPEKD